MMDREDNIENRVAKRITSYLDTEVSGDISSRLASARLKALRKRKTTPWYRQGAFSIHHLSRFIWVTGAVCALSLMFFAGDLLMPLDEIVYHMEADKLPSYIIDINDI